jgi:hypothetical protein
MEKEYHQPWAKRLHSEWEWRWPWMFHQSSHVFQDETPTENIMMIHHDPLPVKNLSVHQSDFSHRPLIALRSPALLKPGH